MRTVERCRWSLYPLIMVSRNDMGLFDTVFFDKPFTCSNCGSSIDQVQTKAFDPGLREYHIGDLVSGSSVFTGIIREELYCVQCNQRAQSVYLAIWHTLIVGAYETHEEAETRLASVDRADLMDYIMRHQSAALRWHDRFSRLYGELQILSDFTRDPKSHEATADNPRFFRIRQYVDAPDPLSELISSNKPVNPEDETEATEEQ